MNKVIVSSEKKFIVAKTNVARTLLCEKSGLFEKKADNIFINLKARFSLYYMSISGALEIIQKSSPLGITINCEVFRNIKDLPMHIDLYFIKDGATEILVPWGCNVNGRKFHGELKIELSDIEKYIINFESLVWEKEIKEGFTYEYLSEYFIDNSGIQRGLSIDIRDKVRPVIEEYIKEVTYNGDNVRQSDLSSFIKSKFDDEFNSCGLIVKDVSFNESLKERLHNA